MIYIFKRKITTDKFFQDGTDFKISKHTYYISYPDFLKYFNDLKTINRHNLVISINFTYGWMPTIFNFCSDDFDAAIKILNRAKLGKTPTVNELQLLKEHFNNSLVGTSKLLHFINPNIFAILDGRVYRYLTGNEPYSNRIGNCSGYLNYLELCDYLTKQKGYKALHKSIEKKVGYSMTTFRTAELIMYCKGA